VFVHELGHFVMAKRAGMKVEEFGFGFPPRMFGVRRGETIYSVNWIPIGGFVKIMGEDGNNPDNPESFGSKGFWARFAVLIAGVTMNVIFAWLVISLTLGLGLPTVITDTQNLSESAKVSNASIVFSGIQDGSPAEAAGLRVADKIIAINGEPVETVEEVQKLTQDNLGKETKLSVTRGKDNFEKVLTPRANPPEGQGPLGVSLDVLAEVSYPWWQVLFRGATATWELLAGTVTAFITVLGQWISGESVSDQLSGPVGIAVLTRDVTQLGFIYLLQFTALLSINLAVVNAFPFPALDGGRIVFLIIEKIRRKKLPETAEGLVNTLGFALLILLMVFVTVRDFGRFEVIDKLKNLF
jgi:regulator of sigma E protease